MRRLPPLHRLSLAIPVVGVFAASGSWTAQEVERPRVHLVATGGSIAKRDSGRLTADQLVAIAPGLEQHARVKTEQFRNLSSSSLTLDDWVALSRRIQGLLDHDHGLAGVVVTSGTDTLEELAYFLHLTITDGRPVVVVGSMRTPDAAGYDGGANLVAAVRASVARHARGRGVLVVMNGDIHSAREVAKTDADRVPAFESRGAGRLGVVEPNRVRFERTGDKRHTVSSEFGGASYSVLPRVDIVLFYQGASGDLIQAAIDRGAQGIVVAVAGADASGGTMGPAIARGAIAGVPIVLSTRTGSGRIRVPGAEQARLAGATDVEPERYVIGAEDLPPLKARILLMLALTRTENPREIQRMFTEY